MLVQVSLPQKQVNWLDIALFSKDFKSPSLLWLILEWLCSSIAWSPLLTQVWHHSAEIPETVCPQQTWTFEPETFAKLTPTFPRSLFEAVKLTLTGQTQVFKSQTVERLNRPHEECDDGPWLSLMWLPIDCSAYITQHNCPSVIKEWLDMVRARVGTGVATMHNWSSWRTESKYPTRLWLGNECMRLFTFRVNTNTQSHKKPCPQRPM